MSASEEMVREQIDSIIVRAERRCTQQCTHANSLVPYGNEAKRARTQLALLLTGMTKLKTLRSEFSEPAHLRANSSPGNMLAG